MTIGGVVPTLGDDAMGAERGREDAVAALRVMLWAGTFKKPGHYFVDIIFSAAKGEEWEALKWALAALCGARNGDRWRAASAAMDTSDFLAGMIAYGESFNEAFRELIAPIFAGGPVGLDTVKRLLAGADEPVNLEWITALAGFDRATRWKQEIQSRMRVSRIPARHGLKRFLPG